MNIGSTTIDLITVLLVVLFVNYTYFKYERFMHLSRGKQSLCWLIMGIMLVMCGLLVLIHI